MYDTILDILKDADKATLVMAVKIAFGNCGKVKEVKGINDVT